MVEGSYSDSPNFYSGQGVTEVDKKFQKLVEALHPKFEKLVGMDQ